MFAKPQQEHEWLEQLVGQWTIEQKCTMPDGTASVSGGQMTCRSVGGLWLIAESSGPSAESDPWHCIMTLGYDPAQNCYVGTFIGSMMTHLWPYRGTRDAASPRLTLDSEGPKFDGTGTTKYRDTLEIISPDKWLFYGEVLRDDGTWFRMMDGEHRRA
jgi:hypothetical protein